MTRCYPSHNVSYATFALNGTRWRRNASCRNGTAVQRFLTDLLLFLIFDRNTAPNPPQRMKSDAF